MKNLNALSRDLKRIRDNTIGVSNIEQALAVLDDNRVIHFLRALGRPMRENDSTPDFLASEASYNAGWHDALDALLNFRDWFLVEVAQKPGPKADYGARRTLLNNQVINEKEFNYLGNPTKHPVKPGETSKR